MATEHEELSDDEIEARQRAEDGEDPNADPQAGAEDDTAAAAEQAGAEGKVDEEQAKDPATPDAAAAAAAPAEAAAAEAAGADAGKPEGVLSKDGTRVLPYAALQAERRSARSAVARATRLESELEQARQQIADMKAGKTPEAEVTEEDVKRMEENFPEEGKKMRALFDKAQAAKPEAAPPPEESEPSDDPVQDAIDQVPLLLEWQHGDPNKFARAVELDNVIVKSPKWADKPAVERFAHVTAMVADEYGIEVPKPKASTTPPPAATPAPATAAAAAAQRKPPESLSDFKGGAVADHGSIDPKRMQPSQLLNRMSGWSDDEIDAHLAKYGDG